MELEVECSEEYYALLRKRGKLSGKMTKQLHHMITSAYFTAVCETIAHDMPKEEAMRYIEELAKVFQLWLERLAPAGIMHNHTSTLIFYTRVSVL